MRYPLIDGQGNFGSVDGDAPAAMRYTEVRLARLAHEMLRDIDKETVDFVRTTMNHGGARGPADRPAQSPGEWIVRHCRGMATNIPPHNLGEVVDAVIAQLEHPDISLEELMRLLPGPDFPTAGYVHGRQGIIDAYRTAGD